MLEVLEIHLGNSLLELLEFSAPVLGLLLQPRVRPHLWKQHQGVVFVFPHPLKWLSPGLWHSAPSPGEKVEERAGSQALKA